MKGTLQTIRMMGKISIYTFVMITFLFNALLASKGHSQIKSIKEVNISIDINSANLTRALDIIERNSDFHFVYEESELKDNNRTPIEIYVEDVTLESLLLQLSKQANVSFRQVNDRISVRQISKELRQENERVVVQNTVSGIVTDENDQPLPGATILEKGTTNGTVTDIDGKFSLTVSQDAILSVSFVGFEAIDLPVNGRTTINIALDPDVSSLDEVVVVGYGTMKKSDLTGSVASVSSEELTAYPTSNAVQAMQGRAAGVQIQPRNGEPGSDVIVRIRGASSINAGSDPIFVVDGFVGASLPPAEDIESIEILKDASATAIYGSRGANGVIIVTTKRGKIGETKININASHSVQQVIKKLDLLNREEYIPYREEVSPGYPFPEGDTDWQDVIFEPGKIQNYQLSVSGGKESVKYYLSGIFYDQEGIIINSKFNRISLQNNLEVEPVDGVRFGSNIFLRQNKTEKGSPDVAIQSAYSYMPSIGIYNEDGTFARQAVNNDNPYVLATEIEDETLAHRLQANLYGEVDLFNGLTFRTSLGASENSSRRGQYSPTTTVAGEGTGGDASANSSKFTTLLNENYLTYINNFLGGHNLNVVGDLHLGKRPEPISFYQFFQMHQ